MKHRIHKSLVTLFMVLNTASVGAQTLAETASGISPEDAKHCDQIRDSLVSIQLHNSDNEIDDAYNHFRLTLQSDLDNNLITKSDYNKELAQESAEFLMLRARRQSLLNSGVIEKDGGDGHYRYVPTPFFTQNCTAALH